MHSRHRIVIAISLCGLLVCVARAENTSYALLVGITRYPNLPERIWLEGPYNDVGAMKDLLTGKFGFLDKNIRMLREGETLPTKANIEKEFQHLIDLAKPGDTVFIMLGGHGTQVPAIDEPGNDEPDGMDEAFLPRDVEKWPEKHAAGATPEVKNIIRDNQFGQWLAALDAKGVFAWIVFDACCSGTMTRGINPDIERPRRLGPEDLGIPKADFEESVRQAQIRNVASAEPRSGSRGASEVHALAGPAGGFKSVIAFYAAQSNEETYERAFAAGTPQNPKETKTFGILSHEISGLLYETGHQLSYRELMQRLIARYEGSRNGRPPHPMADGALDRQVLGLERWPQRSLIRLSKTPQGLQCNAGTIMGLTPGCRLAVYPPQGWRDADKSIGYVTVLSGTPTESLVQSCGEDGAPAPAFAWPELPSEWKQEEVAHPRCEIVYQSYGSLTLNVAVVSTPNPADSSAFKVLTKKEYPQILDAALRDMAQKDPGLIQLTRRLDDASWILQVSGNEVSLLETGIFDGEVPLAPTKGGAATSRPSANSVVASYGPYPLSDLNDLARSLHDAFLRVYRWQNLRRLGGAPGKALAGNDRCSLSLELRRCLKADDVEGVAVTDPHFQVSEFINVALQNNGTVPLYVWVFYLDDDLGIQLAQSGHGEAIPPDKKTRYVWPQPVRVNALSKISEHILAIAIPKEGAGAPPDYSFLLQEPIVSRGVIDEPESDLGKLLMAAAFHNSDTGTRGLSIPSNPSIITLRTFRVVEGLPGGSGK